MKKYLAATFLSGAMFGASLTQVRAMEISSFDQMSNKDKADYTLYLVAGTKTYLEAHGYTAAGQQVRDYFMDNNGNLRPGADEFLKNLQIARSVNQRNVNNPNKTQYQVEDAFALTLKSQGIIIPINDLLAIGKDFKPSASVH